MHIIFILFPVQVYTNGRHGTGVSTIAVNSGSQARSRQSSWANQQDLFNEGGSSNEQSGGFPNLMNMGFGGGESGEMGMGMNMGAIMSMLGGGNTNQRSRQNQRLGRRRNNQRRNFGGGGSSDESGEGNRRFRVSNFGNGGGSDESGESNRGSRVSRVGQNMQVQIPSISRNYVQQRSRGGGSSEESGEDFSDEEDNYRFRSQFRQDEQAQIDRNKLIEGFRKLAEKANRQKLKNGLRDIADGVNKNNKGSQESGESSEELPVFFEKKPPAPVVIPAVEPIAEPEVVPEVEPEVEPEVTPLGGNVATEPEPEPATPGAGTHPPGPCTDDDVYDYYMDGGYIGGDYTDHPDVHGDHAHRGPCGQGHNTGTDHSNGQGSSTGGYLDPPTGTQGAGNPTGGSDGTQTSGLTYGTTESPVPNSGGYNSGSPGNEGGIQPAGGSSVEYNINEVVGGGTTPSPKTAPLVGDIEGSNHEIYHHETTPRPGDGGFNLQNFKHTGDGRGDAASEPVTDGVIGTHHIHINNDMDQSQFSPWVQHFLMGIHTNNGWGMDGFGADFGNAQTVDEWNAAAVRHNAMHDAVSAARYGTGHHHGNPTRPANQVVNQMTQQGHGNLFSWLPATPTSLGGNAMASPIFSAAAQHKYLSSYTQMTQTHPALMCGRPELLVCQAQPNYRHIPNADAICTQKCRTGQECGVKYCACGCHRQMYCVHSSSMEEVGQGAWQRPATQQDTWCTSQCNSGYCPNNVCACHML